MKAILSIDYDVEGKISKDKLEDALLGLIKGSVICSEDIDDTDDWAIILNYTTVELGEEK